MSSAPRVLPVGPERAREMQALHAPLFDPPWTVEAIAGQLSQAGSAAAAIGDEQLDGFVLFRTAADEAEILLIAVASGAQGRGLGKALLAHALRSAASAGARTMWLEAAVDNAPALGLYRNAGFEPAGRRPRYYSRTEGDRVDALLFRRALHGDCLTGSSAGSMLGG